MIIDLEVLIRVEEATVKTFQFSRQPCASLHSGMIGSGESIPELRRSAERWLRMPRCSAHFCGFLHNTANC